jgi:hypothetical protein
MNRIECTGQVNVRKIAQVDSIRFDSANAVSLVGLIAAFRARGSAGNTTPRRNSFQASQKGEKIVFI